VILLALLALSGQSPKGAYLPFSSRETLNVELIATWSDGDSLTTGLSVAEREGYVYLAMGDGGLWILDARWPEDSGISEVALIETLGCYGAYVRDTFLYVGFVGYNWLKIYSVSNPSSPVLVGSTGVKLNPELEKQGTRVVYFSLSDSLLFYTLGGDYAQVFIFDISDPTNPSKVGSWGNPPGIRQVAFTPPCYLYCASAGIYILDVSDPANPVCVDSFGLGITWEAIETEGDLLVATSMNSTWNWDISDPVNPMFLGGGALNEWVHDILMRRNGAGSRLLYVAGDDYFEIFDVTDGSYPVSLGKITKLPNAPTTIYWDRGYIYISDYTGESIPDLYILHYLGDTIIPPDTQEDRNHYLEWIRTVYGPPGLRFSLEYPAYVSFSLFGTSGSKAYQEDLGLLGPGPHTITLPRMRAGVYVLYMKTNEESFKTKLVFTRP